MENGPKWMENTDFARIGMRKLDFDSYYICYFHFDRFDRALAMDMDMDIGTHAN
jgi:hypothetical protein